jgi:tetratricopeptide (TPR) repeat protein
MPKPAAATLSEEQNLMVDVIDSDVKFLIAASEGRKQDAQASYARSINLYRTLLTKYPQNARAYLGLGVIKNTWQAGSGEKELKYAIDLATRQIKASPRNDDLYYVRGSAYRALKQYALAKDDVARSFALNPKRKSRVNDLRLIDAEANAAGRIAAQAQAKAKPAPAAVKK